MATSMELSSLCPMLGLQRFVTEQIRSQENGAGDDDPFPLLQACIVASDTGFVSRLIYHDSGINSIGLSISCGGFVPLAYSSS